MQALLYDPQTSGGLLLLVPEAEVDGRPRRAAPARRVDRAARGTQAPASDRRRALSEPPCFDRSRDRPW